MADPADLADPDDATLDIDDNLLPHVQSKVLKTQHDEMVGSPQLQVGAISFTASSHGSPGGAEPD